MTKLDYIFLIKKIYINGITNMYLFSFQKNKYVLFKHKKFKITNSTKKINLNLNII